jgi:hypothetical protein
MNEKTLNIDAIHRELKQHDLTVTGIIASWTHPVTGRSKRLTYEGMVLFLYPDSPDLLPDTFSYSVATADDPDGAIALESLQEALDIYNNIDLSVPPEPYQLFLRAEKFWNSQVP